MAIVFTLKTGMKLKSLPAESEGQKMSGEWTNLSLMPGKALVLMDEQVIIVPQGYRKTICETFHEALHQRFDTMYRTLRRFYMWPNMRKMIKASMDD